MSESGAEQKLQALSNQGSDQSAVTAVAVTGHVAALGYLGQAGVMAWRSGGMRCLASRVALPLTGALIGAKVADLVGADEGAMKVAEVFGATRQAGHGRAVACVTHKIAHSQEFNGILAGLVAAVAVGALVALTIGTGGLLAPLLIGAAAGFAGAAVAGAGKKMADVTGTIKDGSPNVLVEGKKVARVTDIVMCSRHNPPPQIIEGSKTIFVNSLPLARIGHKIKCSAVIQEGASTVFADNTNGMYGEPDSEVSLLQQLALSAVEVLGARSATRKGGLLDSVLRRLFGEPVDIVTGDYADYRTDFEYPGALQLSLKRTYPGKMQVEGLFGTRWICNWSQRLVFDDEAGTVLFEDAEGQRLEFQANTGAYNALHLKAPYYRLEGQRSQARIFDSRSQQTMVFGCAAGNAVGILHAIEDRNDNRIDFRYRTRNNILHLNEIIHSDGSRFLVTTTEAGELKSVTLQGDDTPLVTYCYDEQGRLRDVHSRFNGEFHYTYTTQGWLQTWRDSGPTQVALEYDSVGRVVATRTPQGLYNDEFQYFPTERKSCYIDATGAVRTFSYNADNLVTREIDPIGNVSVTEWDYCERKLSQTDALGRTTRFEYDGHSRLANVIDTGGRKQAFHWNEHDQLKQLDLANGESHQWHYDDRGNCIANIGADGIKTEFIYDQRGRVIEERRATVLQSRWSYSADGKLTGHTDAIGALTQVERDRFRRVTASIDPLGQRTEFDYSVGPDNPRGSMALLKAADGGIRRWQYDQEGLLIQEAGAEGQRMQYKYGAFDLLQSIRDGNGQSSYFSYDKAARLTSVRNALGREWGYSYDAAGRLVMEVDWAGRQTCYDRDAIGRLLRKRMHDGSVQQLTWDENDRLREVAGRQVRLSFTYDKRDRLECAVSYRNNAEESHISYRYDDNNRIVEEVQNGIVIQYAYDAQGRCIQRKTPAGETAYRFNARGDLEEISSNGHVLHSERNKLGQEILRQHQSSLPQTQNAFTLQQKYDPCGRLTEQVAGAYEFNLHNGTQRGAQDHTVSASQPLIHPSQQVKREYAWDKSGRLVGIQDSQRGHKRYAYDIRDQVQQIERSHFGGPDSEKYRYDAGRNLQLQNVDGQAQQISYEKDCVAAVGDTQYVWDELGRLISRRVEAKGFRPQIWNYQWDDFNRLIQCVNPQGQVWAYRYDAFGRRIGKQRVKQSGQTERKQPTETQYLWNGPVIVEEWRCYSDGTSEAPGANSRNVDKTNNNEALVGTLAKGKRAWDEVHRWHYAPGTFIPLAKECLEIAANDAVTIKAANASRFYPIVTDHLGTPKEIYTATGECVWKAEHTLWGNTQILSQRFKAMLDGFGNELPGEGREAEVDCTLRFANQWEDSESGLFYNLNRYYDPHSAQYASQDPLRLAGGLRTHGYVHNPVGWIDPLGLVPGFGDLMDMAGNSLDFSTAPDGAVFWSGPNMKAAQQWASSVGKTTLEQTKGGQYLNDLDLFNDPTISKGQAAQIWDVASKRFAEGASGDVHVFSTKAARMGPHGERTWWRVEKPALLANKDIRNIIRMRKNGVPVKCG